MRDIFVNSQTLHSGQLPMPKWQQIRSMEERKLSASNDRNQTYGEALKSGISLSIHAKENYFKWCTSE